MPMFVFDILEFVGVSSCHSHSALRASCSCVLSDYALDAVVDLLGIHDEPRYSKIKSIIIIFNWIIK